MRKGPLCLLLATLSMGPLAQAEEEGAGNAVPLSLSAASQINDLQQRLKESERLREDLGKQLANAQAGRESAQLSRLRQENQNLKLQLRDALANSATRLLTDQQQWFITGGGVALLALLCGIFASGGRRQRRQWLN